LFLASVGLAWLGFAAYLLGVAVPRERKEAEGHWQAVLTAMADDRELAIERWVSEGMNHARTIAGIGQVIDHLQGGTRCNVQCLTGLLRNYSAANEGNPAWILDAHSETVASVGPLELDDTARAASRRGGRDDAVVMVEAAGKPWVSFMAPVRAGGTVLGWIVLARDPAVFLFPFLRLQALTSATAEAVLFERRDDAGVNLSPLRKPPHRPFALRLETRAGESEPPWRSGRHEFRHASDYAAAAVVDVTRPIAGAAWVLSVKADREEVYAEVWPGLRSQVAIFVALLSIASALGISLVRSRQAAYQRELRLSNERLLQSQKVEAIGRLAGGVAHDFNNTLNVILGHTEQALRGIDDSDPRRRNLLEIRKGSERAASLTRQLLAFSRRQVLQPRVLELNGILLETEEMLRPLLGENVELKLDLAGEPCHVLADPGQIEQVILNLVVNARDAMPSGGHLQLSTAAVSVPDPLASLRYEILPAGRYVRFSVCDDGVGMRADVKARVFEPFFTTKELGQGPGLGLSTVYGIVKQSGGFVFVESALGAGASFHIFLPRTEPAAPAPTPAREAPVLGGECILLVEDNDALRELTRETLELLGYRVLEAIDGPVALEMARHHTGAIDLLLTDVVMPKMGGTVLAERLAAEIPGIKVLFISGYTADAVGVLETGRAFLAKPFTAEALEAKVREVLAQRS